MMSFGTLLGGVSIALLFFGLGVLFEAWRCSRRPASKPELTLTTEIKRRCTCGQVVTFPANFAISDGYHGMPMPPHSLEIIPGAEDGK